MLNLRHLGTLPTSSCALVSLAESPSSSAARAIPVLLKTYLRSDVARYDLLAVVQAERTALVRLAGDESGLVARLISASVTPSSFTLTMVRAPGRPAFDLRRPMPLARAAGISTQLCDALQKVHGADVVHADLTLRNVIVDESSEDAVCLVDFGSCFVRGGSRRDPSRTTSAHVLAPELLHGAQPDPTADVWALGILIWTLLLGGPGPFGTGGGEGPSDAPVLQELQRYAEGDADIGEAFEIAASEACLGNNAELACARDFICLCLARNPANRFCLANESLTLSETPWSEAIDYRRIKQHPFHRLAEQYTLGLSIFQRL